MHRIQQLAADVLGQVESGRTLTEALAKAQHQGGELTLQERAALQDICYGSLRQLARLRFWLRRLVPKALPEPQLERVLLVAFYQLVYTRAADYAVVNEAVKLAERLARGKFKALVNGVLRNFLRQREEMLRLADKDLEAATNHPRWWVKAIQQAYPQEWSAILQWNNSHPPMTLRVNARKSTVASYLAQLEALGMAATALDEQSGILLDKPVNVRELPGFADGVVSVQDWGAQQAARLLDLQAGQRVLDACAAPGGKTCHMLELADVNMTALDIDPQRLTRVAENLQRGGLQASLHAADAGQADWWDGKPFDRILADVPCSASGVVRRHPDIKWLRRPGDFASLARQQAQMVDTLWGLLAPGGKMLYATCSIFPEENQQQLEAFLARHADAECLNQQQLLPCERHDGFYYALLAKH
jgi:16S rRNA (cytosine967-C5)-methyltransferase